MGKVARYFQHRQQQGITPGAAAAARGSVAARPWHAAAAASEEPSLVELAMFCCTEPEMAALLGDGVSVTVRPSDSGRGVVFEFEPAL